MERVPRFCSLVLTALLLAGCATATPVTPTSTSTPTKPPMPSATPTETPSPSSIPTATPTATATPLPDPISQCTGSVAALPVETIGGEFVLQGDYSLYLSSGVQDSYSPSYIWAPGTGAKIPLPQVSGEELSFSFVSPDKQKLAYLSYYEHKGTHSRLIILGNDGETQKQYLDPGWDLVGWVDSNRLLLGQREGQVPYPAVILNPFSGE